MDLDHGIIPETDADAESSLVDELRDLARRKIDNVFRPCLRFVVHYSGDKTLALYCLIFAMGWGEMIECRTAVDIAVRLYGDAKKKAAVTKCLLNLQDTAALPKLAQQRTREGRRRMIRARAKQLR